MRKLKSKTNVTGSRPAQAIGALGIAGTVLAVAYGPVAGLAVVILGIPAIFLAAAQDREEADRLIDHKLSFEQLRKLTRGGEQTVTLITELENLHKTMPPLGRITFGDSLKKETTYFLED